jgi:UPF0755 protein
VVQVPAKRRSRLPGILLVLFLLLLAGAGGAYWFVQQQLSPVDPQGGVVEVEVMPGWGASRIAQELAREELIRRPEAFTLWLRYEELDRSIGEGLYDLSPAMSVPEIAQVMQRGGRPRIVRVVIPEGFRARDVATRLAGADLGERARYLEIIDNPGELRPEYVPEDATLEGYLFPASYDVPVRSSPEQVVRQMLERFEQELDEATLARLDEEGFSVHEWVILASVIQSEAGSDEEMPIISGVFRNRLDEGMMLQSDPTVAYGLGIRLQELDSRVGHFTMSADHAWNTYTRTGLPAGPISNPGHEALQSVLAPQRHHENGQPYLYFLHNRDGTVFRPNLNLEDHERDVQLYLR